MGEAEREQAKDLGLCHRCGSELDDGYACLGDCPPDWLTKLKRAAFRETEIAHEEWKSRQGNENG